MAEFDMNKKIQGLLQIVEELRSRGIMYCESIRPNEWKKRGWPEDRSSFIIIDSLLKIYRDLDRCSNGDRNYKLSITIG